jgi:alpha-L-rhamnosidase
MRNPRAIVVLVAVLVPLMNSGSARAQIAPELLSKPWSAQWITCPDAPQRDPFVFHFRKVLDLQVPPPHFLVHVSADNLFLLYVNQQRVGSGPAHGDLAHWRFETYDLGPLLHSGRNIIAATVWGFGTRSALAQISDRAGFLLQGNGGAERAVDTNESWEVEQDKGLGVSPEPLRLPGYPYFVAGPPERMDAALIDWSWNADPLGNQNTGWVKAVRVGGAMPRESQIQLTNWLLVPDPLPPMAMELGPTGKVVRASGIEIPAEFPDKAFVVPAHLKASVLIDVSHLITGYPELTVKGGAGASIRLTYAEALIDEKNNKGNRNEIQGRHIAGVFDEILPDGSQHTFMPFTWRTWRFLQLDLTTADQPIQVERLRTWFTAYPFQERGHFESEDSSLGSIWEIGWRTARLDAHDTYMDTPYWERLQYTGDTRIQALISYAVGGDDRLAKQAIQAFNDSRIPDGLTQSRYPTSAPLYIPTFSLLWVGMVHDFWLYRADPDFVRAQLSGTRTVLDWFLQRQRGDGLLTKIPWWVYVDWASDFDSGEPPQDDNGGSSALTLQFIEALQYAAEMESAFGEHERAEVYRNAVRRASEGIRKLCWNEKYGLLGDTPAQKHFSQHANILGVWLDVIPQAQQKAVMTKILSASDAGFQAAGPVPPLSKATYYFRFYLARALDHAGMGNEYVRLLQPWREMMAMGLSTWAEKDEPTRSDSHAWSAHPNFDLLTIVVGIRPGAPEFKSVLVEPHLGSLKHVGAVQPHPNGEIKVEYTRDVGGVEASIGLPPGTSGRLIWGAKDYPLHEGEQKLTLPNRD